MPVQDGHMSFQQGLEVARVPVQEFGSHTREQDLLMFMEMANGPR